MSLNFSARFIFHTGIVFIVLVILGITTMADVPRMIQYQGRLTDDTGNPMDTTVEMTFRIYQDSSGGLILWTETHPTVTVTDGLFTVKLGSLTPIGKTVFNGDQRWLGISIDGGGFLDPRTSIASTAYAIMSQRSDTATYSNTANIANHALTSQHADTADVVLGGAGNGWVDTGNDVYLSATTDSVGIGTTSPRAPLDVEGPGHAIIGESHGSGTAAGVYGANEGDGFGILGYSNEGRGVTGLSLTGFGGHFYGPKHFFSSNLGIGTESPDDMLHVYADGSAAESFLNLQSAHASNWGEAGIRFQTPQGIWRLRMDDDSNTQVPDGGIGLRSQTVGEVMTWLDNGRVGIGTTSPNYPLEIVASGNTLRARCTGSGIGLYASSSSGFGVYSDATKQFMGGLTGFGQTDPTHRVTVNGSLALQGSGTTEYHIGYMAGGLNVVETSVADYRLFIKNGGNVGIGTSNPQSRLDVNGTITADGMLSTSITDEAGLASNLRGSSPYLGSSWHNVKSRTISVPGPGYVVAMSSGYCYTDHGAFQNDKLEYGISASSSDVPENDRMWLKYGNNADAGRYWLPIAAHNVFEVTSAGDYDYYFLARRAEGDEYMWVSGVSLILFYVPTAYGTVTIAATKETAADPLPIPHETDEQTSPPDIDRKIKSDDEAIAVADLEARLKLLLSEAETIRQELDALKDE
jgi:hypothetical protein